MNLITTFKNLKNDKNEESLRLFVNACHKEFYATVYVYALSLTGTKSKADDLIQETFFKFQKIIGKENDLNFSEKEDIHKYLVTITRNQFYSVFRKDDRYEYVADFMDYEESKDFSKDFDLNQDLQSTFKLIAPIPKLIFFLKFMGYSVKEIAVKLSKDPENVKKILYRTRKKLKGGLNEQ